ncbi:MAG: hypothetical protein HRT61_22090 [Ekhidna sp.]|nr:hypothetical protein [Ekhidna sp.]
MLGVSLGLLEVEGCNTGLVFVFGAAGMSFSGVEVNPRGSSVGGGGTLSGELDSIWAFSPSSATAAGLDELAFSSFWPTGLLL